MNDPSPETEGLYDRAFRTFKRGHYAGALQRFLVLLKIEPLNSRYLAAVGACYQRLHRYEEALRQ